MEAGDDLGSAHSDDVARQDERFDGVLFDEAKGGKIGKYGELDDGSRVTKIQVSGPLLIVSMDLADGDDRRVFGCHVRYNKEPLTNEIPGPTFNRSVSNLETRMSWLIAMLQQQFPTFGDKAQRTLCKFFDVDI